MPRASQVSTSAACSSAISSSEWNGVGVIRNRSVPRGTERLRITPTPFHSDELIAELQAALVETWDALGIPYGAAGRPSVTENERIVSLLVPKSGG